MQDEYLTRCVVDPVKRKFFLYSSDGDERVVDCETVDQFMTVLELVRDTCDDDVLAYASPLWGKIDFYFQKSRKKNPGKKSPYRLFMLVHPLSLYKEILECYEYETRNPTIYGNVIRGEVEFTESSEERRSDQQGDENHL